MIKRIVPKLRGGFDPNYSRRGRHGTWGRFHGANSTHHAYDHQGPDMVDANIDENVQRKHDEMQLSP